MTEEIRNEIERQVDAAIAELRKEGIHVIFRSPIQIETP